MGDKDGNEKGTVSSKDPKEKGGVESVKENASSGRIVKKRQLRVEAECAATVKE